MSIIPGNSGTAAQMVDGILGVTDGSSASAGNVGEVIESVITTSSAVSLSTGTTANITNVSLTNGDWELTGAVGFIPAGTTSITILKAATSRTSATLPASTTYSAPNSNGEQISQFSQPATVNNNSISIPIGPMKVSVSGGSVTQYLVAQATFTVSTMTACGYIHARRLR